MRGNLAPQCFQALHHQSADQMLRLLIFEHHCSRPSKQQICTHRCTGSSNSQVKRHMAHACTCVHRIMSAQCTTMYGKQTPDCGSQTDLRMITNDFGPCCSGVQVVHNAQVCRPGVASRSALPCEATSHHNAFRRCTTSQLTKYHDYSP